ncbi:multidrug effflux MFS transporter [Flavobacterium sp. XS2P12]|uniref:multidrug effflux MFS transporter n=1 Tax=Flavobacterium melibiosi TaxID=3398734 RepID=UPI003A896CBE
MTKTKEINIRTLIIVLGCLNGLMPFSTDLYLPAFPAMAQNLGTNVGMITLSMSTFFAGACVGQFFNGPLLDRFGRKNPMLIALAFFFLTSLGCAVAGNIILLCVFRFFQAISISVCSVGSRAMVRDVFPVEKIASMFSTLSLIMGIAPIIAPTLGGFILLFSDWRGIFIFLAVMALLLLVALHFFLPHVKEADANYSLKPKAILGNYKKVILTKGYMGYAIITALASAVLFSWISSSSLLFIGILGISKQQFGWIFASTASCMIIGSQFNRILLRRFSSYDIAFWAVGIQLLVCCYLLYTAIYSLTVVHLLVGMCFFMLFLSLISPNTMAITIRPFTENIGSANAIMGVTQMALSALVTAILSYFQNGSAIPMVITMIVLSGISFMMQYVLKQKTI